MFQRSIIRDTAPPGGWESELRQLLERISVRFGPLYWWPATDAPPRTRATPFEVVAGAILVQNVAWKNAEQALLALRKAGLLELRALCAAPPETVEPLIRSSGYFRQKAKKLKAVCTHLYERYGADLGGLADRPLPDLRAELLALPGIGPETCDCILNYAAGKPVMPMDAYTRRIFSRLGIFAPAISYAAMQGFFHTYLPEDAQLLGEYHAQIDTLGHRLCLKSRPHCGECPLGEFCPRIGTPATA